MGADGSYSYNPKPYHMEQQKEPEVLPAVFSVMTYLAEKSAEFSQGYKRSEFYRELKHQIDRLAENN